MTRRHLGALAAVLAAAIAVPIATSIAGPPWISIEYPVNPYDETTRDAFLVVHAFHHGTPMAFPVNGTAEGIVNGKRTSQKLEFKRTTRTGVYALNKQWNDKGTWTLVISVLQAENDKVSAVVELGANGSVASVNVPTKRQGDWVVPAQVVMADVDASLAARAQNVARR